MRGRFVITKLLGSLATLAFVVVFNFFLFRVVATDPVANLFRGRNLTQAQRDALIKEFGLDGSQLEQFWNYLQQTASLNFGRSYVTNEPVMSEIADKALPTIALVGVVGGALGGLRHPDRHRRRVAPADVRPTTRRRRAR